MEITNPTELVRWRAVSEKRSYGNQDHQENSRGFPGDSVVKNSPAVQETWVRYLGWEDPLEKGKATHSSILAWRIPWTVEPMGSHRVGHN